MRTTKTIAVMAAAVSALALAGCSLGGGGGLFSRGPARLAPTVTADGTQQFSVPPEGRPVLARTLVSLIGNPDSISDAKISNAWRTPKSAQAQPGDYAACVSASTPAGVKTFIVVVSGSGTNGHVSGPPAAQRCADRSRVVLWEPLPEAVASL